MALHRLWVRAGLVVSATAGVALVVGRLLAGVVLDGSAAAERSGPAALDAWVGTVAAAGALLALCWWSASFTVAVVAQARRAARAGRAVRLPPWAGTSAALSPTLPAVRSAARSVARSPAPSRAQRLAAAALGVALTAGPGAAHAAVDRPAGGAPSPTSPTSPTSPAETRDAADRHDSPRHTPWSADRPAGRDAVVVRPGDTLWTLAAAGLGDDAKTDERADERAVAAAWPRWWHANRAVVGPDPDLIRPGQVLHPPTDPQETR